MTEKQPYMSLLHARNVVTERGGQIVQDIAMWISILTQFD